MEYDKTAHILIIDDDKGVALTMTRMVERMGMSADCGYNLKEGMEKYWAFDFDLVLLDVNLPDGNGIDQIEQILEKPFPPQVIILTAFSDPDGAELAIEHGAWDYIQKPVSAKDLKLHIIRALQYREQKRQSEQRLDFNAPDIIGAGREIGLCKSQASRIAASDANVLITGETGTGKELFAKAIHNNSARQNEPFIVVDCSILTENFIESVLFGHEKGAFTGAEKKRNGLISLANGGTLFLDEVGELPESIQASFLRVLQEKKFRPVGGEQEIYSDFRVLCATNKNLEQMASDGRFRTDLLYRLTSFTLEMPPLRKRVEDIPLIAVSQIKASCEQDRTPAREMAPDFVETLEKYDWPGNVRELINVINTCVITAGSEKILFAFHLPQKIRARITRASVKQTVPVLKGPLMTPGFVLDDTQTYKAVMDQTEKIYLESIHTRMDGNIPKMIQCSGISRAVLYRKLKKHGIQ